MNDKKPMMSEHQPSITEWFAAIGEVGEAEEFRTEDSHKTDRLETLYQMINLPYERPVKFEAQDLKTPSPEFESLLKEKGHELCAIRLVPKEANLPKLRNRGLTLKKCYEDWFLEQEFEPEKYWAYVCPHADDLLWSTIFVVSDNAIYGEIVRGRHSQLTQGDVYEEVYRFKYDFKEWHWQSSDKEAEKLMMDTISLLKVDDEEVREKLKNELATTFGHNYIKGYFETTVWPGDEINFIDYNRILPKYFSEPSDTKEASDKEVLSGAGAYKGIAEGEVVVIEDPEKVRPEDLTGKVLLSRNTDIRFVPHMKAAVAVVTEVGGVLSHASIVARELKKPTVVGVSGALSELKTGDRVQVDGTTGIISRI